MNREEVKKRLENIYQEVFDDESIVLEENMTSDDIEQWDSITNLRLIMQIEKNFEIKFTTAEMKNMKNVGILINLVFDKTNR